MWEEMAKRNMRIPQPSEQEVADLFAYFYSWQELVCPAMEKVRRRGRVCVAV